MRTWQSKCAAWRKRAILCKNHRLGNGNTQVCVLTRAKLDLLRFYRATHLHSQNEMDKASSRNSVRCLAWWRAVRHAVFSIVQATATRKHAYCREPCSVFALLHATHLHSQNEMDKDSSHNSVRCLAWWRAVRHAVCIGAKSVRLMQAITRAVPYSAFLKVRSSPLYARTYTYIHARTDSFIQEL